MTSRLAMLALGAVLLAAPEAAAQIESREGIALQNQIQELRRDIQALQRGGGGGGSSAIAPPVAVAPAGAGQQELLARLLERVSALETDLRLLRGRSDETQNALRELQATVEKNAADTDFRLQQLEQGGQRGAAPQRPAQPQGGAATAAQPQAQQQAGLPRPPAAPPAAPAPRSQQQILAAGIAALGRQDWAAAEREATLFLSAYPRDARVGEAHQIRGEAFFGRRDFAQAALAFDDAQRRLSGNAQQDAQLRLGQSLAALNERAAACEVFARLASQHATSLKPDVREAMARERQRLRC
jgi:TolA-binding protein